MGEGVEPVDFIKLWGWETNAICRGKRQRGILPTQIERNNVGRWGCTAGWLLFRIGDEIMIWDAATIGFKECRRTFDLSPMNWWKCVPVGQQRLKSVWRKTTVASLMAWYDRVLTLQLATVSTHELAYEESKTRMRNKQIVTRALHRFQGGRDLCSIFPVNYIGRMNLIGKSSGRLI